MLVYKYSMDLNSSTIKVQEDIGRFDRYTNKVSLRGTYYPLNKIIVTKSDMSSIQFITDSEITGDIKDYLVAKLCREIDDTIVYLSNIKTAIKEI